MERKSPRKKRKKTLKYLGYIALGILASMFLTAMLADAEYAWMLFYYEETALFLCGMVLFITVIFNPKCNVNPKKAIASKRAFIEKHKKTFDGIARLFCALAVIFMVSYRILPAVLDIPSVLTHDLVMEDVIITTKAKGDEGQIRRRNVGVMSQRSGEEYRLHLLSYELEVGDRVRVRYLPYSKFGIGKVEKEQE